MHKSSHLCVSVSCNFGETHLPALGAEGNLERPCAAYEGVTHINEPQLQRQQDYRLAFTERARHDIRSKSSSASHDFLLSKSPTHCCWQLAHHSVGVYIVLNHAEWITLRSTRIVTRQTYNAGLTTRITRS